jgi:glycosyltransferase involved in cell wall biosynthesis
MDISVVVPTFNRRQQLLHTLSTLFAQNYPADRFEIIVVVDGSQDGTAESLKDLTPPCRLRVVEQPNRGPAAARNTGYRAAESELVLFLDDDMLCAPELLAAHVATHRTAARVVGFGAIFLSSDSPPSLAAECFKLEIGAFHLEHLRQPDIPWDESECVFSNTSMSTQLLSDAGGFDEAFRMREDLEIGVRLFDLGAKPRYIKDATTYQVYTKSAEDLLSEAELFAAADVMFAKKHPGLRVRGHTISVDEERGWRQRARQALVSSVLLETFLLAPPCLLGQTFIGVPKIRNLGVRALRTRRKIRWLRAVERLRLS